MCARQYVPGLGRFLEVDPVEDGSANDYDYVGGDPVNRFDLNGDCWQLWQKRCRGHGSLVRRIVDANKGAVRARQGMGRIQGGGYGSPTFPGRAFLISRIISYIQGKVVPTGYGVFQVIICFIFGKCGLPPGPAPPEGAAYRSG